MNIISSKLANKDGPEETTSILLSPILRILPKKKKFCNYPWFCQNLNYKRSETLMKKQYALVFLIFKNYNRNNL